MKNTLKQRAIRSGSWVIFGHLISQVLRLGSNLILTRLLVPEMFGVMVIITAIMAGLAMFSDVGLLQNIVQSKRGEEPDYLNTAWTIQIMRGFFIFFIALISATGLYYAGQYGYLSEETVYGNKQLPFILAIVSSSAIISAFNSIHILLLNRKLMLGKRVVIELLSQILGLVFMLTWAWYQRDIWALVFGGLVTVFAKMFLSHSFRLGERCRLCWDKQAVHEIFHFGKWIFISSIFVFLLNQGDRLLLGGLINPEILGVYTVAFIFSNALKDICMKLLGSIFFPLLSEVVRSEPNKVESVYYNIRFKVDLITMPVAGFLFSTGRFIIEFLYDERYSSAGVMLEILSISTVTVGFMLSSQLLLAYGKPKYISFMGLIQLISFYILVPMCFHLYGFLGAIWVISLNPMLRIIMSMIIMKKKFFLNFGREIMMFPLVFIGFIVGEQLKLLLL